MKTFIINLREKQHGHLSHQLLISHVEFLKQLKKQGHLVLCGPLANDQGGIIILEAESLDQANQLIEKDPFLREAYYKSFDIKEFFLADDDNNWLMDHKQTLGNFKSH